MEWLPFPTTATAAAHQILFPTKTQVQHQYTEKEVAAAAFVTVAV